MFNNNKCDSLLSVVNSKRFYWSNNKALNYDIYNRPRRQDFDGIFVENGALYMSSVAEIIKSRNRISGDIITYTMPEDTFIEIDELDDWFIAEQLFIKKKNIKNNLDIKLFLTDVDGVLTDAGMYYSENGDELKKFNTRDGKGLELLKKAGIKTGIITSENTQLVERRSQKLKLDFLFQGANNKLKIISDLCKKEKISLNQVAYIGDDINDFELLSKVGLKACPNNAVLILQQIPGIIILKNDGGNGVVREFSELILSK